MIQSSTCSTCTGTKFDTTTSSSYKEVSIEDAKYFFGGKVELTAHKVSDKVCLGLNANCANNFPFQLISLQKGLDSSLSGILGLTLGSPTASSDLRYKLNEKFIDYLFNAGQITEKKFSTHLGSTNYIDFGPP